MNVLVTGTDGYIGTVLGGYLMDRGHDVTGIDTGFHRIGWLYNGVKKMPQTVNKDIRNITDDDLRGFDAVVHLAELSNDPVGQLNPRPSSNRRSSSGLVHRGLSEARTTMVDEVPAGRIRDGIHAAHPDDGT